MADYFTSDHFKLLNKWKDQRRDESNPEQNRAYEELKKAYEVTRAWADKVKEKLFPAGRVEIRRAPIKQSHQFASYNWAKIYPSTEAPKELAYVVGIDAVDGFVVEIETVGLDDSSATRQAYLRLRGTDDRSALFVAKLPADEGLDKTLDELVAWSVDAIRNFRLRYDEVVTQLGLGRRLTDEEVFQHFDRKPGFQEFRAAWSPEQSALFCRLARAIHGAGLDWWHVDLDNQVRFGRKNPGKERADSVLGLISGSNQSKIQWTRSIGPIQAFRRADLTPELVERLEAGLLEGRAALTDVLPTDSERPGLWPDELHADPMDMDMGNERDEVTHGVIAAMSPPINRIYYGPPGTGKTYQLTKLLKQDYEQPMAEVSSEEWRRQFIVNHIASLTWWEGAAATLIDLGGKAKVVEIHAHPFIQAIASAKGRNKNVKQTLWGTLQHHTIEGSKSVNTKLRMSPAVFDKAADSVWVLAGDWKDVCSELEENVRDYKAGAPQAPQTGFHQRHCFVTFHQSYGYEEFVEGLRPMLDGDTDSEANEIKYKIQDGAFKKLCAQARSAPGHRFAMVIDEINRGNISKIFGELITLIEPDKRDGGENAVSVTLPYSGEPFSVPANVDIIGTMNTADRSLALLDTALRRRFDFVPVLPDTRDEPDAPLHALRVQAGGQVVDVPRMLQAINQRIEALYDRDHSIGHAYLTSLSKVPDGEQRLQSLAQVFQNRILPLLEEYFFEDWQKIRLVLADNQKPNQAQFVLESENPDDDLIKLFGTDHGLDSYTTKRRYSVQHAAFMNPAAYIGVYLPASI